MIRDIDGSAQHTVNQEYSLVYEYLGQSAAIRSPQETILKFQNLLKFAKNEDVRVVRAFEKIIVTNQGQFKILLNQCLYGILDCWVKTPKSISYFGQLFDALEAVGNTRSYDRCRQQLVQSVSSYLQSESCLQLKTIVAIIEPDRSAQIGLNDSLASDRLSSSRLSGSEISGTGNAKNSLVNAYLVRYTYLYKYFLPQNVQAQNLLSYLEKLQQSRQQDFEIMLSKHIIYRFRLKQLAKMKLMTKGGGKMITRVENPSLLSERAFRIALQQYLGKIDNNRTILERSQLFVAENEYRPTYKKFKQDLYRFLISNIEPRNSTYRFNNRLEQKLQDIFARSDDKPLNGTLMLQTCRQLFSFLIIDPALNNDPNGFVELAANLGTAQVMMILVKIVLICPESKGDLEKKIYHVLVHYQLESIQKNPWLLKSLEHLSIAFSICFGKIDVSIARSAISNS